MTQTKRYTLNEKGLEKLKTFLTENDKNYPTLDDYYKKKYLNVKAALVELKAFIMDCTPYLELEWWESEGERIQILEFDESEYDTKLIRE